MSEAPVAPVAAAPPIPAVIPAQVLPRNTSTALYVGDLTPDVNEAILYETFNNVGLVTSIRVCRDVVSKRSLGYAYVNYQNPGDAERALDTLNFTHILGRPMRIMWCQRDPALRRSGVGNIFVKGLHESIDHKELNDAFSVFGNIVSCKVVTDEEGKSKGYGFVQFENAHVANEAMTQANGTMLKEKVISVQHFKPRAQRVQENPQHFNNVFIKNLPETFDDQALITMFAPHGEITSSIIMRGKDGDDNKSRGFGFVCYKDPASATAAVTALDKSQIGENVVYVGRAMKKGERKKQLEADHKAKINELHERTKGVNLYIKNIPDSMTAEQLKALFDPFGAITSHRIMADERGLSRGFGFVCFHEQAEATRAVTEMNGRMIENKPIYVAIAQAKEERRQHLMNEHRVRQQQMMYQPYPQMMMMPPYGAGAGAPYGARFGGAPFGGRMGGPGGMMPGAPHGARFGQPMPYMQPNNGMYRGGNPYGQGPQGRAPRQMAPRMGGQMGGQMAPGAGGAPRRQNQPGGRFTNMRQAGAPVMEQPQAAPAPSAIQTLASSVAQADADRAKQILGDHLYGIISTMYGPQAGKLTGMLLQMDNSDLLHLLEDQAALRAEVDKAYEVLMQHQAQ